MRYSAADLAERGRSLERLAPDPDVRGLLWSTCKDRAGATPGGVNSMTAPARSSLQLELAPNPFSPDGDGEADALVALVEVPEGYESYRLRIFDLAGERRATLYADRLGSGTRQILWEGRDDEGKLLERGFYVLELELDSKLGPRLRERRVVGLVRP
jgi:hypothetical protein